MAGDALDGPRAPGPSRLDTTAGARRRDLAVLVLAALADGVYALWPREGPDPWEVV
ncbi:MAG: hypothetical protein H6828_15740 [Planctomycetes bacterium]|nr:hypothetical protein [Planctomycetota bacterium]